MTEWELVHWRQFVWVADSGDWGGADAHRSGQARPEGVTEKSNEQALKTRGTKKIGWKSQRSATGRAVAFEMIPNSIRPHSAVFFLQFSESVFFWRWGHTGFARGRGEGWSPGPHRPRPLGPILVILELCGSPDEVGWPRKVFPGWIGPGPARWSESLPGGIFFRWIFRQPAQKFVPMSNV